MSSSRNKPLVMVVDDDEPTRMMATEFLSQAGFDVVDFASGVEALESLTHNSPDVFVLDVEMPEMDGFAVCRRLRETPGFDTTPVLMLTGLNSSNSIESAFQVGATDFATKPINWSLLCHRLRYMLHAWQSAQDLKHNQRNLAVAQRIAQMGNWHLSLADNKMYWSEHLYTILNEHPGEQMPSFERFISCVCPSDQERVKSWIDGIINLDNTEQTIDFCISDGSDQKRYVHQQIEHELDTEGRVVSLNGVVRDLTEKRRTEHRLDQLAHYDSVTNLPNRTLFQNRLDSAITDAQKTGSTLAVLYIDIDDFKLVNDSLGHAAGDIMLNEVARRISNCADNKAACIARMGADEFTVMLTNVEDKQHAVDMANRVLNELSQPYLSTGEEIYSSSSIGIALYPDHGACAESVVTSADIAMSGVKRDGKNHYRIHDEKLHADTQNRFRIESLMRQGLERDEFQVYYQPQIDLDTGKLYSAEALIRWINPELGFVSPGEFIPIAEDTGFIVALGEWVLRTACEQAVLWQQSNFPITQVAVNISVLQFVRDDFPSVVERILDETGLAPEFLELEITESLLASDTDSAVGTLCALKAIGVQLSIDDFGTGYSSLSQLKNFPIDRLKLDQSFVQGVTTNDADAAITRAVIAMTHSMNVKLLAEGVETIEQLEFLKQSGCHEIQGFYICKPAPADVLAAEIESVSALLQDLFDAEGNLHLAA